MLRSVSIAFALGGLAVAAGPAIPAAHAKEYNNPTTMPSDVQAMVNRIKAEFALEDDGGNPFERDCESLNIGTNPGSGDQTIIADKIVNIGGRCRVIGRNTGVRSFEPRTPIPNQTDQRPVFE